MVLFIFGKFFFANFPLLFLLAYRLYTVVPRLVKFVDNLTNWYVRMNRRRLKGSDAGRADTRLALDTLFSVLLGLVEMMAPFTPFITETMFQNLRQVLVDGVELPVLPGDKKGKEKTEEKKITTTTKIESIHYSLLAPVAEELIDEAVERQVALMQTVVELGRLLRDRRNLPLKYPLPEVVVISASEQTLAEVGSLREFILAELNVRQLVLSTEKAAYGVQYSAVADIKALGLRLRGDSKRVIAAIR